MKIRHGFVTNSSSSSYIIGIRPTANTMDIYYYLKEDNPYISPDILLELVRDLKEVDKEYVDKLIRSKAERIVRSNFIKTKADIQKYFGLEISASISEDVLNREIEEVISSYNYRIRDIGNDIKFYSTPLYEHDGDGGTFMSNILADVCPKLRNFIVGFQN